MTTSLDSGENEVKERKVLFVDDEQNILNSLKRIFRQEGYLLFFATSGEDGLKKCAEHKPEVIISDQRMPEMNGAEFLEKTRTALPDSFRILLTGHSDLAPTIDAINRGRINRYFHKPWDDIELRSTVKQAFAAIEMVEENQRLNLLTAKQNQELHSLNNALEKRVEERTKELELKNVTLEELNIELENNFVSFIRTFVGLLEIFNKTLGTHSKKVASISSLVGKKMGLDKLTIQEIEIAGLLHDIGLAGMSGNLLSQPLEGLSESHRLMLRQHPCIGEAILGKMKRFVKIAAIIRQHHENYDGSGYPDHKSGESISIEARVVSVVDAFDEVRVLGVYKNEPNSENPRKYIALNSKKRFDPDVVSAFGEVLKELSQRGSGERQVFMEDVKNGMTLSRDINSSLGIFIMGKDTVLNENEIQKLKSFDKISSLKGKIFVRHFKVN